MPDVSGEFLVYTGVKDQRKDNPCEGARHFIDRVEQTFQSAGRLANRSPLGKSLPHTVYFQNSYGKEIVR
jgi:hypothetical protein